VSLGSQGLAQHLPDLVFVVNKENRAAGHWWSLVICDLASGDFLAIGEW
jgi:hypothetical protein